VATKALGEVVDETLTEIVEAPAVFPPERAVRLAAAMRSAFETVRALLLARGARGSVRRCHGDLHLRNIALLDRGPVLFDAIEFDESIATTDVLYDLAFAIMDLWERRLAGAANLLLNRYLWRCDDPAGDVAGLAALPLFLSLRAAVLAKIDAIRFRDVDRSVTVKNEARRYFEAAVELLAAAPPVLIAIGGLSGSGKSTLAARIAPAIGRAPGAVHLRSDIERKRLLGAPELQRLPESAYRREVTDKVFAALRDHAGIALRAGHGTIVDAVHRDPEERRLIADVAARAGARFVGLWLDAPVELLVARVERRTGDASDATGKVVKRQAQADVGPVKWTRLDASVSLTALADTALAACGARLTR
jgi:predicted kinase